MGYPEILLPLPNYPILKNEDVKENAMMRETTIDLYQFLEKPDYEPDDILSFVIAPQPSLREVFELSIFLYGYFEEKHIGIRVDDTALYDEWNKDLPEIKTDEIKFSHEKAYPLFFSALRLDKQEINFNGETHLLSFSHKPTKVNFWHFELWIKNSVGNRIPRNKSNAHIRYLAKSILEYIIAEAVISRNAVNPFKFTLFEK